MNQFEQTLKSQKQEEQEDNLKNKHLNISFRVARGMLREYSDEYNILKQYFEVCPLRIRLSFKLYLFFIDCIDWLTNKYRFWRLRNTRKRFMKMAGLDKEGLEKAQWDLENDNILRAQKKYYLHVDEVEKKYVLEDAIKKTKHNK
jgi:hypothetical protein